MGDVRAEIVLAMHILHERPPFLNFRMLSSTVMVLFTQENVKPL